MPHLSIRACGEKQVPFEVPVGNSDEKPSTSATPTIIISPHRSEGIHPRYKQRGSNIEQSRKLKSTEVGSV